MNISRIILISLGIFVFSNTSINNLTKEQEESLKACLLLKIQAPYLKLDCDTIAQNNIKKIKSADEIKLRNLIRKLRN